MILPYDATPSRMEFSERTGGMMSYWKGPGADSEEKREPVSDIDTVVVDSLKALDPKRPIREADISEACWVARSRNPDDLVAPKRLLFTERFDP